MKSLTEHLNEGLVNEASTQWKSYDRDNISTKGVDTVNLRYYGNKKYGFLSYMTEEKTAILEAADSPEELAEVYSLELEYVEDMFKLKVGESMNQNNIGVEYTMRIW